MNLNGNILWVIINPYVFKSSDGILVKAYFNDVNAIIASNKQANPVLNKKILNHKRFLRPTH